VKKSSLGTCEQGKWLEDLEIERLLEEGGGKTGLNIPLLMYLTLKYVDLQNSS